MRWDALLTVGSSLQLAATVRHIEDAARSLGAVLEESALEESALEESRPPPRVPVEGYGYLRPLDGQLTPVLEVLGVRASTALADARRYEAARQRERWIEGVAAVTTALLSGESDALMTVAERARLLADAAAGVILQRTPEGGMEIVAASTYDDPGDIVGTTIRAGSPVLVQLLGGEPVFVDDSATDPRMTTHVRHRFGPSMMLPLQAEGQLIGTLALPRRRGGRPYTPVEKRLAVQFAAQAALALLLADTRQRRERLAVYEDRDRIARDLHDLVIQRLFATGLSLQATQRRAAGDEVAVARIGAAVTELESTVAQIRTAILHLQQPPTEPPLGVRARVLREVGATLGFQPAVRFAGAVDTLVPEHEVAGLLAALREALAGRSRADVVVSVEGGAGVRVVVDGEVVWGSGKQS